MPSMTKECPPVCAARKIRNGLPICDRGWDKPAPTLSKVITGRVITDGGKTVRQFTEAVCQGETTEAQSGFCNKYTPTP